MSLAPPYNPTASFSNDETNQVSGRSTVRTVAVDTELANIATTVNALKSNLEKLQRDDDKLLDFLVEPYALAEQTRALIAAGGRPRGLWAAGQVYAVGDVVQQTGFAYQCYTAHTATAPFTANGFWISISGDGSAATNAAAAAASEAAATAAAAAAAASVTSAGVSATAAAASATTAGTNATAAGNSATAAAASAAAAAVSVGQAATSANAANASAIAADASADAAAVSAAAAAAAVGATIALTNDSTTNTPHYLTFADGTAGQENLKTDTAKLAYNPSTGDLTGQSQVGDIKFVTKNVAPSGWLKANGATLTRATYPALWAAVDPSTGGAGGVGNGTTTFTIPDIRGEFIRGWDDSRGVDSGRVFGSAQADEFESHVHFQSVGNVDGRFTATGSGGASTLGATNTGAAGGTETRPRNVALLAVIKF